MFLSAVALLIPLHPTPQSNYVPDPLNNISNEVITDLEILHIPFLIFPNSAFLDGFKGRYRAPAKYQRRPVQYIRLRLKPF